MNSNIVNYKDKIYIEMCKRLRVELVSGYDLSVLVNDKEVFDYYFDLLIGIGVDIGIKEANRSHANGMGKKVRQMDDNGNEIKVFDNAGDAARHVKASGRSAISMAIRKKQKCKKFRYV